MKKFLSFFLVLFTASVAFGQLKISQLPMGNAAGAHTADSFPYVDSANGVTKRLTLYDIANLPSLVGEFAPINNPVFTGTVTGPLFVGHLTGDVVGNVTGNLSGVVTGSLVGNASTATALAANPTDCTSGQYANAIAANGNLTCAQVDTTQLTGTVTNAQLAGSITDSKLNTISTAGKVANSATTATNANTASAIVARDASGNFTAGTITAALSGNSSTATALAANPTDCSANQYANAIDASGNLTCAQVATSQLSGSIAASQMPALTGDVTTSAGTVATTIAAGAVDNSKVSASAGIVDTKLATISTAGKVSNSATTATNLNTASAIVARDGSGNFSAGTITASLSGNATNVTGIVAKANGGTGTDNSSVTFPSSGTVQATTPNQYGVLLSGSGATAVVLAPDASTTKVLTSGGSSANPSWQAVASAPQTSYDSQNVGISGSVSANALTIALKQSDGSTDCSSGAAACNISFRSSTATSGSWTQRSVTSSLSITVPSSTTLGTANGGVYYIMIYALDNAGTVELALSVGQGFDEGKLWSTTAVSGGSSITSLYSTTARTSKAVRLLGRIRISEVTAGTWASAPTEASILPFPKTTPMTIQKFSSGSGTYTLPTSPRIPLQIHIRMVGGGAGGSGSGTASAGASSAGGDTTFGSSLLTAGGGGFADIGSAGGGLGGSAGVNAPAVGFGLTGGTGGGATLVGLTSLYLPGGIGGSSAFGGAGRQFLATSGGNGASNTGGGGAGAGQQSVGGNPNNWTGAGGGSGAYVDAWIINPASTYSYAVGAGSSGGTAGTNGFAGGNGGSGLIVVEEYYQ